MTNLSEEIRDFLEDYPLGKSVEEIADAVGADEDVVEQKLNELEGEKVSNLGGDWVWTDL